MAVFDLKLNPDNAVLHLEGTLDMDALLELDRTLKILPQQLQNSKKFIIDVTKAERIEPNSALRLLQLRDELQAQSIDVSIQGATPAQVTLLEAVSEKPLGEKEQPKKEQPFIQLVNEVGETTIKAGHDSLEILSFFGEVMRGLGRVLMDPSRLRFIPIITHIERAGLRAVPIVCLMSFLIGAIVAQQGAFQLRRFGADVFVVNLIGILVLRELGVLLAAIMFAGRSGSAYTAEIGSMKMREEIDAMKVIGLHPVEVLVIPRLVALIIALPLVTILSNLSALLGGLVVCWAYVGISPENYITQIQTVVPARHIFIGLVKAPFMAIIIGIIACIEGMRVGGSTDSLGQQTTASVVKAIFMVIVVDGIFAMVFAAMDL